MQKRQEPVVAPDGDRCKEESLNAIRCYPKFGTMYRNSAHSARRGIDTPIQPSCPQKL